MSAGRYSKASTPQTFLLTPKLLNNLTYTEDCMVLCIFNGPWIEVGFRQISLATSLACLVCVWLGLLVVHDVAGNGPARHILLATPSDAVQVNSRVMNPRFLLYMGSREVGSISAMPIARHVISP